MSNCENFDLPAVEAGQHQFREVLRCLCHTILFHRALGNVSPKDIDSDLFDITYVTCDDPDVESKIEAGISEFCTAMERRPRADAAQLCVAFYELRKNSGWFGLNERLYWEQWHINVAITQDHVSEQHSGRRQARQQATLLHAHSEILRLANERRDHIPPLASALVTYPFDILIEGGSRSAFDANVQAVKKMLMQTVPPSVL